MTVEVGKTYTTIDGPLAGRARREVIAVHDHDVRFAVMDSLDPFEPWGSIHNRDRTWFESNHRELADDPHAA